MTAPRKPRHNLTAVEEAALAADLSLREALVTKVLMRKYNASRTVIDRVKREVRLKRQNAFIEIHAERLHPNKIG